MKVHLQLWLVENNITAIQQLPNNDVQSNYVHNHVLRDAINGAMGEEVSLNSNTLKPLSTAIRLRLTSI